MHRPSLNKLRFRCTDAIILLCSDKRRGRSDGSMNFDLTA